MYNVSNVVRLDVAGQLGVTYGFNITTVTGEPMVNFAYRTEAEANAAARYVVSAIGTAIRVLPLRERSLAGAAQRS